MAEMKALLASGPANIHILEGEMEESGQPRLGTPVIKEARFFWSSAKSSV